MTLVVLLANILGISCSFLTRSTSRSDTLILLNVLYNQFNSDHCKKLCKYNYVFVIKKEKEILKGTNDIEGEPYNEIKEL